MSEGSIHPEDSPRWDRSAWSSLLVLIILYLVAILVFTATSCSPRIVERVEMKHDTTYVVKRDSIHFYDRDSIFVKEKGDTVYKYVERWRWRDRVKVDTLVRVRVDSVTVERTKEVQVEKPLSGWKSFKIGAFWWLLGAAVLLLCWTFRKSILKLLKI